MPTTHFLPGSARGQSPARVGKKSVQLWQSERHTHLKLRLSFDGIEDDFELLKRQNKIRFCHIAHPVSGFDQIVSA